MQYGRFSAIVLRGTINQTCCLSEGVRQPKRFDPQAIPVLRGVFELIDFRTAGKLRTAEHCAEERTCLWWHVIRGQRSLRAKQKTREPIDPAAEMFNMSLERDTKEAAGKLHRQNRVSNQNLLEERKRKLTSSPEEPATQTRNAAAATWTFLPVTPHSSR